MFHDTVEDVDELSSDEDDAISSQSPRGSYDPELTRLRTKLTSLHRQRARIRTNKVGPVDCYS